MKTVLKVEGMSCEHCVRHVTEALVELEGVHSVQVDLGEATATVDHDETVTADQMKAAVEEVGYDVIV